MRQAPLDAGGAFYPTGAGNFLFTPLIFSLYTDAYFWLLVESEMEKAKDG